MWPTEARTGGAGGADGYPARAFLRPATHIRSYPVGARASTKSGGKPTCRIC